VCAIVCLDLVVRKVFRYLRRFEGSADLDKQTSECYFRQHKHISDISDVRISD